MKEISIVSVSFVLIVALNIILIGPPVLRHAAFLMLVQLLNAVFVMGVINPLAATQWEETTVFKCQNQLYLEDLMFVNGL